MSVSPRGSMNPLGDFQSLLNFLRAEEGDSITLLSDNPDFNGQPSNAVECNGDWTDWKDRRFTGDTLIQAVTNAAIAKAVETGQARPSLEPPASDVAGWRPIESAPKDGTWFDAWRAPSRASGSYWEPRITVRWDEEGEEWVWPDNTYEAFTPEGIERANAAIADCEMYADKSFTHWMPLPAPPHPASKEPGHE